MKWHGLTWLSKRKIYTNLNLKSFNCSTSRFFVPPSWHSRVSFRDRLKNEKNDNFLFLYQLFFNNTRIQTWDTYEICHFWRIPWISFSLSLSHSCWERKKNGRNVKYREWRENKFFTSGVGPNSKWRLDDVIMKMLLIPSREASITFHAHINTCFFIHLNNDNIMGGYREKKSFIVTKNVSN